MNRTLRQLRLVRTEENVPWPKASLFLRGGARALDLLIAWTLYYCTGPAGIVIALLYLLFADGMLAGQSLGKKAFGVKAIYLPNHQGTRHRDSVLRNAPFGLVVVLRMMPDLGLRAFVVGAVVVLTIETMHALRDPSGLRLGDLWAQTQVIDGKVVNGQGATVGVSSQRHATVGRAMKEKFEE